MSKGKEFLKVKVEDKAYIIEQLEGSSTVYKVLCSYKSPYGNWNNYTDIALTKSKAHAIKKLTKYLKDREKDYLAKAKKYTSAIIKLETKRAKDEGI